MLPAERVFALPAAADGGRGRPDRLRPGALAGATVLVQGGAGAVGNAAIQLARWAGATVVATVSSEAKATLAAAAGAEEVVNYEDAGVADRIRDVAADGVDLIVEVAAAANAELDLTVLRPRGTISIYANDRGAAFAIDVRRCMSLNVRYQFVLLYTVGWDRIAGALRVGECSSLTLHHFDVDDVAGAHAAVENATVGKVLITVGG